MEIHLLRHTEPAIPPGYCYGQMDLGLADSYGEELQQAKARVANGYDAVYASSLYRCERLARDLDGGEPAFDPALLELDFGDWEGEAWSRIPGEDLDHWMADIAKRRVPGGESLEILYERVRAFLERLRERRGNAEKVLLVTHGGVIRCSWVYALGFPLPHIFRLDLPYGGLSRLLLDEKGPGIHKVGAF